MDNDPIENPLNLIKKRAIKSIALLTGRTFILQAISFTATFLLTVLLTPGDFGVFFLVSAAVSFFAYFSDVGLAAALIQKKESLTDLDLKTTFTVQQTLVLVLFVIIIALTPLFNSWYNLGSSGVYLLWAVAISLVLSSLKTIPSVLLERELHFDKLIIPQIFEAVVFNFTAVFLAWLGWGVTSFTIAVLLRGIIGLFIIYLIKPWKPSFSFSMDEFKHLMKFGLPYQLNTFLAVFKDDGLTAVLGGILGVTGMGYLGWAQKWAYAPLRFFMDTVIKVTFPAFSRMQDDKVALSNAVSRSIFFISCLVFPTLIGLVASAPLILEIIPKYNKWQEALIALALISINSAFAAVTTPLTNVLNSIGKIKITFNLMIMWTVLSWVLVPLLAMQYGINGAAFGYALVGLSSIIAITIATHFVKVDFWQSAIKPLIASIGMGLIVVYMIQELPHNILVLAVVIISGFVSYFVFLYMLYGRFLLVQIDLFLKALKERS